MNQTANITLSAQAQQLAREDSLAPVRHKIACLEAENGALRESLDHHLAELQRAGCVTQQQTLAILESYNRERQVSELLAHIVHKAHLRNAVEVIRLATEALRVLA